MKKFSDKEVSEFADVVCKGWVNKMRAETLFTKGFNMAKELLAHDKNTIALGDTYFFMEGFKKFISEYYHNNPDADIDLVDIVKT